jgi:NADH dehydrogenase FAD-containing subunit
VPGADRHAFTLDTPDSARRLAARLQAIPSGGSVVVCGNGLTGIEAAAEIAEAYPQLQVQLLGTGEPGAMLGPKPRAYLLSALSRLGVQQRTGATVTEVGPDGAVTSGGTIPADACLWTTGFWASPLAAKSGIQVDGRDRIIVDGSLRSVSHPTVLAIGDSAAVRQPWGELHGTCQSGIPTAVHAADTLARLIAGKEPRTFRFGYFHQPVSLGRHDAVIGFTRADETPRSLYLKGKRAIRYKETVSGSPAKIYRLSRKHTLPEAFVIPTKGGRATRPA